MRKYKEIIEDINKTQSKYNLLQKELTKLQNICTHEYPLDKHLAMSCGYISRWAYCTNCYKRFNLQPEPGDNP